MQRLSEAYRRSPRSAAQRCDYRAVVSRRPQDAKHWLQKRQTHTSVWALPPSGDSESSGTGVRFADHAAKETQRVCTGDRQGRVTSRIFVCDTARRYSRRSAFSTTMISRIYPGKDPRRQPISLSACFRESATYARHDRAQALQQSSTPWLVTYPFQTWNKSSHLDFVLVAVLFPPLSVFVFVHFQLAFFQNGGAVHVGLIFEAGELAL